MIQSGTQSIKKVINNDQKFKEKIENKNFLMGKFEENLKNKLARKAKRPKKLEKSKLFEIMSKQYRASQTKSLNYSNFAQLNKVWNEYIKDLIQGEKNESDVMLKILRADFHGSRIQVLESKVKSYEGIRGIVIKETLRSFVLVTQQDRLVTLLKQNSLFLLVTGTRMFKIYGCNLVYRSADRAKHKFKAKSASEFILASTEGA